MTELRNSAAAASAHAELRQESLQLSLEETQATLLAMEQREEEL